MLPSEFIYIHIMQELLRILLRRLGMHVPKIVPMVSNFQFPFRSANFHFFRTCSAKTILTFEYHLQNLNYLKLVLQNSRRNGFQSDQKFKNFNV